MFLIDNSPSMGQTREVELPLANGETQTIEMTNLEWSLQFVKLKIQEMVRVNTSCDPEFSRITLQIYNGRKTDQCGVILFGSEGDLKLGAPSLLQPIELRLCRDGERRQRQRRRLRQCLRIHTHRTAHCLYFGETV